MNTVPHTIRSSGNLLDYVNKHQADLALMLNEHGALLLRGMRTRSLNDFQTVSEVLCDQLFDYTYRSSPRTQLGGNVYTSTEYPKEREIPQHNENAYSLSWPNKILFHCVVAPEVDGETPIADSAEVYQRIDPEVVAEFEQKKVRYVRNYKPGLDIDWRVVFQTDSKQQVETYCQQNQIEYEWKSDDWLQTSQVCQSSLVHDVTGKKLWFNQAHLFHESVNDEDTRKYLLDQHAPDEIPRNAFFGDGSPISDALLDNIRKAYKTCEICFPWEKGDLMILDNLRFSHGRRRFDGRRRIVVAMGS